MTKIHCKRSRSDPLAKDEAVICEGGLGLDNTQDELIDSVSFYILAG